MIKKDKNETSTKKSSSKKIKKASVEPEIAPAPEPIIIEAVTEKPRKNRKKIIILIIILLLILTIGGCYNFFSDTINKIIDKENSTPLYKQIQQLATETDEPLKGNDEDRINILLLGMGGQNHNGGTLTDTIMIASIKPSTNEVGLISLPRDLVVKVYDEEDEDWWESRKINYMYEIGGTELAIEKITEVTGLNIHYNLLMDFSGFLKLIDDVGGVTVNAPSRFNGYYHIADVGGTCSNADGGPVYLADGDGPYCIFKFFPGEQEMAGQTALMYSRIRKVAYSGPSNEYYEGSDYARSKRQQLIMEGFKTKILSASTLANPIKITKIFDDLGDHVSTNMELWEMAKLAKLAETMDSSKIINKVIDENNELVKGFIYPETGAFVIVPTAGEYDFSEIQQFCANIFTVAEQEKIEQAEQEETQQELAQEQANIIILNGTTKEGLAGETKTAISALNLNVTKIDNAPDQNNKLTEDTIIFDLTNKNPNTLETLKTELTATKINEDFDMVYPLHELDITNADFIIILGADQYE